MQLHEKNSNIPSTLAETLWPQIAPHRREELEKFRIEYEALHGPTDLAKMYSSQLPEPTQQWLVANDPERYMEGLPPFVRSYLIKKFKNAVRNSTLDDLHSVVLRLHSTGYLYSR